MHNPAYNRNQSHILDIEADITKISDVLFFIKEDMQTYTIDKSIQFNAAMATEEIFSNIALYAYPQKINALVTILTEMIDDYYCITFVDKGNEYNPLKQVEPDLISDIKNRKIGGWGVFLSKKLSDDMVYRREDDKNILTIKFNPKK